MLNCPMCEQETGMLIAGVCTPCFDRLHEIGWVTTSGLQRAIERAVEMTAKAMQEATREGLERSFALLRGGLAEHSEQR